ncbi:hypothetical protein BDZ45DRAFT_694993 [Acephala macrosclerotiorum]|nr:hypothetical protein BDZ45DRAFT_694993 [Acephala macrosclerotiorum]
MDASAPSIEKAYDYPELVRLTAEGIPTYAPLHKFLLEADPRPTCEITSVQFKDNKDEHEHDNQSSKEKIELHKIPSSELEKELKETKGHRLLLIENICPDVINLLGRYWDVPPGFFLAHLENSNWYSLQNIPQNLPGLSSVQSLDGYVRFQFIGPREFEIKGSPEQPQAPGIRDENYLLPDRIHEDPHTSSVPRVAGGFNPFPPQHTDPEDGPETRMNPVAFVRNSITIWFDKEGNNWRRGIVLFDPPFEARVEQFRKKDNSKYRSFIRRRPPPHFSDNDIDHRRSYKESFEKCLQHNKHIKEGGVPKPFVLLEDLCRIIASEWLVFNTYIERELNNIESWFEFLGEKCDEKQLHDLLLQLMRARRRVTKYDTLVHDQLHLCPEHWKHETPQASSCPVSGVTQAGISTTFSSPLQDFHQVSSHLTHNKTRISQAIKMVTSLMAVRLNSLIVEQNSKLAEQSGTLVQLNTLISKHNEEIASQGETMVKQSKLAEARNSSLAFLTLVTSLLLPFTTVAAFMAIPADSGLGPGAKRQWIYWVVSVPVATFLVVAFYLDYWREKGKANQKDLERDKHETSSKDESCTASATPQTA